MFNASPRQLWYIMENLFSMIKLARLVEKLEYRVTY